MKFWKWLQVTPTRKLWLLVAILLGVVIILALNGCSSVGIPPVDANHDGVVDPGFTEYVATTKGTVNAVTGGSFAPWLEIFSVVLGLGAATYAKIKHTQGSEQHVENVDRIAALEAKLTK